MSDRLKKLFITGYLARKEIDNVRYGYIAHELAPPDFEMHTDPQDHEIADRAEKKHHP